MKEHTNKLYYSDAYIKSFSAIILSCEAVKGGYGIVLDRTAFYPEGGGQPGDTGRIGVIPVKDTHERDGLIIHYTDSAIEPGTQAECEIDWTKRFSRMQHHTGEHIVSGLAKKNLGLDNVGFHMGSEAVTIDFNGTPTDEDLRILEYLANEAVYKNLPVAITYPDPGELKSLNYRSKKELSGDVRIVTVPDYDICACCGTHTAATGEIGIIKLISAQSYKGGVRITMLCGSEALADYRKKNKSVHEISAKLSTKPGEVSRAVESLQQENAELKRKIWALKSESFKTKADHVGSAEKMCIFGDDLNPNEIRQFCMLINERAKFAAVFSGNDESGYKYAIGSRNSEAGTMSKELNTALSGKGGGSPGLVQGSVAAMRSEIEGFFTERGWEFLDA